MKIAIIGYGKMGKEVEAAAIERGHEIILKIDSIDQLSSTKLAEADVAIEFTTPESAVDNIKRCFDVKLPVIVGTTGWGQELEAVKKQCSQEQASLLYASNFSIGVNILFEVNKKLAQLMNNQEMYDVAMEEIHHTEKKDAPSGTAISLADGITMNLDRKKSWSLDNDVQAEEIHINSLREVNVPGTHIIKYRSDIDELEIKHTAKGRKGFALGAVMAAEWLPGKIGTFTMKDLLKL